MIDRKVAQFDGTNLLTRAATGSLAIATDLYASCFALWTGDGTFIANSTSWSISHAIGVVNFLIRDSTDTTYTISSDVVMTMGQWYFVECYHLANGQISVAVTPASQASPNGWKTPASSSLNPLKSGGQITVGFLLAGQVHSFCLMNRLPTFEEREYLFHQGLGREFWELRAENRNGVVGFWSLKESSGSRYDRSGNGFHLDPVGSVATSVRSVEVDPEFHSVGPLVRLRQLIAATATFQEWTGTLTASDAEEFVFLDYEAANEQGELPWPNAFIYSETSSITNMAGIYPSGTMHVELEDESATTDDEQGRVIFGNFVGRLIEEMKEISLAGGYLMVRDIVLDRPIGRSPKDNPNPVYGAAMSINWGLE